MIAYKASDVKLSWHHHHNSGDMGGVPKVCGYVKEGLGMQFYSLSFFYTLSFIYRTRR